MEKRILVQIHRKFLDDVTQTLTYKSYALFDLIDATPGDEARGLRDEAIHVGLAAFPVMDGHVSDVADVTEGGERGVQEQCEQRPMMLDIS